MSNKTAGAALAGPRPSLWWTESKLGEALARIEAYDPEEKMPEAEAADFIAQFVNPEAVEARRDEFATFLLEGESLVNAKFEMAQAIEDQAQRIAKALQRMRDEAIKIMKASKVKALTGSVYTLKLKDSPGSVAIDDEAQIPPEFFRTREDEDLGRIKRLVDVVKMLTRSALADTGMVGEALEQAILDDELVVESAGYLASATAERRAVDKKAIQAEWKEHGDTREIVHPETGELLEAPMIPGTHKQVDTKLVIA